MEKEMNFIIVNNEENSVEVTSNLEENMDYLQIDELAAIVMTTWNYILEKIDKAIIVNEFGDENIEEVSGQKWIEMSEKESEIVSDSLGKLILMLLNFTNNRAPKEVESDMASYSYSLAVYNTSKKEVYETFHYGEIKENEMLLACFAFFKDIADKLLKNSNSKEKVKQLFEKSILSMLYNICKYIENYNIE